MGKVELDNIRRFLKLRMRDSRNIHTICSLLLVIFLINATNLIKTVLKYQAEVAFIDITVYSSVALGFTLIACVYYAFQYSEFNINHQIFPQTRLTRFVSFELYCYLILIITQLFSLGLYFLQYLLCLILNQIKGNVHLAYNFNISFIITGFFVNLLYGCILISIIILVYNLIRKYHWYALIAYIILFILLWFIGDHIAFQNILFFYTKESSLALFILKAVVTWLFLELISHQINLHTSVMSERIFNNRYIIIASFILLSFLVGLVADITNETSSERDKFFKNNNLSIDTDNPTITLDASKLSSKTVLNIDFDFKLKTDCNLLYGDPFYNSTEDKILIYYMPDQDYWNWVDIKKCTNSNIKATLTNNILHLQYDYDRNIKVVSLYPYSTLSQFKCFRGKHYAKAFSGSMSGLSLGTIEITTPENKQLIVQ